MHSPSNSVKWPPTRSQLLRNLAAREEARKELAKFLEVRQSNMTYLQEARDQGRYSSSGFQKQGAA